MTVHDCKYTSAISSSIPQWAINHEVTLKRMPRKRSKLAFVATWNQNRCVLILDICMLRCIMLWSSVMIRQSQSSQQQIPLCSKFHDENCHSESFSIHLWKTSKSRRFFIKWWKALDMSRISANASNTDDRVTMAILFLAAIGKNRFNGALKRRALDGFTIIIRRSFSIGSTHPQSAVLKAVL